MSTHWIKFLESFSRIYESMITAQSSSILGEGSSCSHKEVLDRGYPCDALGLESVMDLTGIWNVQYGYFQQCQSGEVHHIAYGASCRPISVFQGWHLRVVYTQGNKPRGGNSCHLSIRANSSGGSASSGLDVGRGLGAGVLVVCFTLGIADGLFWRKGIHDTLPSLFPRSPSCKRGHPPQSQRPGRHRAAAPLHRTCWGRLKHEWHTSAAQ